MRYSILLLLVFAFTIHAQGSFANLSGVVINRITREPLPGCNIFVVTNHEGTATDVNGRYSLRLPLGEYEIKFSFVGFQTYFAKVKCTSPGENIKLNVELILDVIPQKEVTVKGESENSVFSVQKIEAKEIAKIPTVYNDVLRSVQILAGVSTNNELTSGYNVRGGTFDENLIYLNGYEIYRPFLLRQGIEENQSLINPILVKDIKFYNGTFPAHFGDKTASVLEVDYDTQFNRPLQVSTKVDLMNAGVGLKGNYEKLNWSTAARIAYPSLFLQKLQTRGDYKPSFSDFQFFSNYSISETDNLELFLLYAVNDYDLTPADWIGHFRTDRSTGFASQISLLYNGNRLNSYKTGLYALRYKKKIGTYTNLSVSFARYITSEIEKANITSDLYYSPDAKEPEVDKEYLFSRKEDANNKVNLNANEVAAELKMNFEKHSIFTGINLKLVDLASNTNEFYSENGPQAVATDPQILLNNIKTNLNSLGIFVEEMFSPLKNLDVNIGLRYLHNSFTRENLLSPRASIVYKLNDAGSLKFGWGYYYQPPFYNEINSLAYKSGELKSQLSVQYTVDWEHYFKPTMKINLETYYKKLDYLIPFYYKDIKPVYINGNTNEGYAFGFDAMLQGELSDGIESRIGYSYLDSKERKKGTNNAYQRRLLDQTHTIQIYFQDRFRKHRNWQSHLRFLVGSGFLYAPNKIVQDETTGKSIMIADIEHPQEIFLYFRVDMGLSAAFDIGKRSKILFIAEVLNLFNHYNVGSYDWIMVFKDIHQLIAIPRILSKRFYNIRIELTL